MKYYLRQLKRESFFQQLLDFFELWSWYRAGCRQPSPQVLKRKLLQTHSQPNAVWIETGTYHGYTTRLLSKLSTKVHTIEPSLGCIQVAQSLNRDRNNIVYYNQTSEQSLHEILMSEHSKTLCFWLDGHYSGGSTYRGTELTPVRKELQIIKSNLDSFATVTVLIDDIRCHHTEGDHYPPISYYISWAESCGLSWTVDNDIFIAKSRSLTLYP